MPQIELTPAKNSIPDTPDTIEAGLLDYRDGHVQAEKSAIMENGIALAEEMGLAKPTEEQNSEAQTGDEPVPQDLSVTAPIDVSLGDSTTKPKKDKLSFGKDIAVGVMLAVPELIGGAIDGANEVLKIASKLPDIGKIAQEAVGIPRPELPEGEGDKLIPGLPSALPTVTGSLIRFIGQFATGFKGVGNILKGLGIGAAKKSASKVAESIGKTTAADLLVFDEQEQRLANILDEVPEISGAVTGFLAADKDDGLLEGKAKQAIEGLALGAAGEALFAGVKSVAKIRKARKLLGDESLELNPAEFAAKEQTAIRKQSLYLGDIENPDLIYKVKKDPVSNLTPEDIQKLGKRKPKSTDEIVINLNRIESPDDIKNVIQGLANDPKLLKGIQVSRRGVQSNKETLKKAEDINGFSELMDRRVGQAFNAEQTTAARGFYSHITEKLVESSNKAALSTASKMDVFNFRKLVAIHEATQREFLGMRAEAGRALQAWSIPINADGVDTKAISEILNVYGGSNSSQELAQRIAGLGADLTTSQLNMITKKSALSRTGDAIREAWTLGLLTSPDTHAANIMSSALTGLAEIPKRTMQALFKDSGVHMGEVPYLASGMVTSMKEALANGAKAFRAGETGFSTGKIELPRDRATRMEALDPNSIMTPLAYAMDFWGRTVSVASKGLAAGDEFARTILANGHASSLGAREGINKGLKGKDLSKYVNEFKNNLDPKSQDAVKAFAEYNIFINQLGEMGQAGQNLLSKAPMLRFVFPFVKAPANIFKYAFDHSPLAFASQKIRDDISSGGLKRAQALAKIGFGSSLMSMSADLSLNGKLTGAGPTDINARRRLQSLGWQPYSMLIGDTYYSYSRLEPVATLFGLSADLTEILTNYESYDISKQESVEEVSTAVMAMLANQVVGKTFLQGVADVIEVMSDPTRYGDRFFNRYAGSFVPAAVGKAARVLDPEAKMVTDMVSAMKARTPGFSKNIPRRRNVWGETIQNRTPTKDGMLGAAGDFMGAWLNPIYMSTKKNSPVDQFMVENGFPVSMPSKQQSFDGVKIDLRDSPEIYSRLLELRGQEVTLPQYGNGQLNMLEFLDELVTENTVQSQAFFNVYNTFELQESYINKVVQDFGAAAKKELVDEFPDLQYEIEREKEKDKKLLADPIIENIIKDGVN